MAELREHSILLSLLLPVEHITLFLVDVYLHGICSIGSEVVVVNTDESWLGEIDRVCAGISDERIWLIHILQHDKATILACNSSQHSRIPHSAW